MDEPTLFEPHSVDVGGVTFTVRETTADDIDEVLAHYLRLSPDDLHRRFFSGYRPDRSFIERWLDRSQQGGTVLVAVEGDPDRGRVVADAGYVPTGADIAELAITVDPDRRGWLGPYLLDVLVEHARLHGIVDLEAEVLTTNCGMLAMLKARGCALRPSDDLSTARLLIATDGPAPAWPAGSPHPRILVEGSSSSWRGIRAAEDAGMAVLVCPGPERGRLHRCPLLDGQHCPLVDEADAVIVALPRSARTTEPLLDAHATSGDGPIALSHGLREFYGDVAGRPTFAVDPDAPGETAVDALRDALADHHDRSGHADGADQA